MHQRGMRLVFGVVKVNVRHRAGFLGASAPNELARCCKELVGDRGKLPQPPPRRPVARLAHEAARLPERIGAVVVPRLYVHVVRDDERDGDQLPIATLPAAAEPLVYITRLAQLPPQPTVPLQKSHHVHRAADGVVAGERSGSHLAVGGLKAEGGHLCESDVGAKNSNSDSCRTANQIRTHVRMVRGRKGASETHSQRRGAPSMSAKKSSATGDDPAVMANGHAGKLARHAAVHGCLQVRHGVTSGLMLIVPDDVCEDDHPSTSVGVRAFGAAQDRPPGR